MLLLCFGIYKLVLLCSKFDFQHCKWKKEEEEEEDDRELEKETDLGALTKYQWIQDMVDRFMERYLKVLLNTMQILGAVETLMQVSFPAPFNQGVRALEGTTNFASIIPLQCIFPTAEDQPTYYGNFMQTSYMPIGASLFLFFDYVVERHLLTNAAIKRIDGEKGKERMENARRDEEIAKLKARNMGFFLVLS